MSAGWIDAGVNLPADSELERFRRELDDAESAGIDRFVLIASDVSETERAIRFAEQDKRCVVTAGVHPHQAASVADDFMIALRDLSQHERVRAIGECGLDYNRNYSPPDVQRRVFAAQLELAAERNLPVYLHERDALNDQIAILAPIRAELRAAFTHCFTAGPDALEVYQRLDCYIGVTGWVCDERRGQALAQAVPAIDNQRLIVETDAPYLLPRSMRPRPKSSRNQPRHVEYIGQTVATLRGQSDKEMKELTRTNTQRLFGIW